MSDSKPKIGVTGPDRGGTAAWLFTKFALWLQGARAVRIQPKNGMPETQQLHALIIGGGADISPKYYKGNEDQSESYAVSSNSLSSKVKNALLTPVVYLLRMFSSAPRGMINEKRDDMEFKLLQKMIRERTPVLGICRGAQLINIYQGGDLHDELSNFYSEIPQIHSIWPKKEIEVTSDSRLLTILRTSRARVNALNYQAINTLGDQLRAAAREENGIIQAIEYENSQFVLGLQWHPEYMPQRADQRNIFKTLVQEAQRNRDNHENYTSGL